MKDQVEEIEGVSEVASNVSRTDEIRALNREMVHTFKKLCPDFLVWLGEFSRFGGNPIDAMVLWEGIDGVFKASFFTGQYQYTIDARPGWVKEDENGGSGDEGYLGAVVSNRKSWAGETWTRGSDLADGGYNDETWQCIMADIIGHEMVRLGK